MTQPTPLSDDVKLGILELAFNDARDNLRFAESKAAFIAVVLTIAVTALPVVPNIKEFVSFKAFKGAIIEFTSVGLKDTSPFESLLLITLQMLIFLAILICILAVVMAIRAAVPIGDPRTRVDLTTPQGTPQSHPSLFYPTGLTRKPSIIELLTRPRRDVAFSFNATRQRLILSSLSSEEVWNTIGDQIIILGYIRDIKMMRVATALKFVLYSIAMVLTAIAIYGLKYFLYG